MKPEDLVKVVPGLPLSQAKRVQAAVEWPKPRGRVRAWEVQFVRLPISGTLSEAQRLWRETSDMRYGMENMRMQLKMCNGRATGSNYFKLCSRHLKCPSNPSTEPQAGR